MNGKAFMSWSGGKDSALALYKAKGLGIPVSLLLTTFSSLDRVSMHGVRRQLLEQQAAALQLPLRQLLLPEMPGMDVYEKAMQTTHQDLKAEGYTTGVFGDLFLADLKQYREALLAKDGLACSCPLWGLDSRSLLQTFWQLGFKAVVVCVNSSQLDATFCGRLLDEAFVADLPAGVDPCGENGEFHSFVFDGPLFVAPVPFQKGEIVYKEHPAPKATDDCFTEPRAASGFYFCDLLPDV